jgi:hypothetical protein
VGYICRSIVLIGSCSQRWGGIYMSSHSPDMRTTTYQNYGTTYISYPIPENNYLSGLWDDIYIPPNPCEQLPIRTMGRHIYPTPSLRTTTYQDYGTTYISHPIPENNYLSGLWDDIYIPPNPCEQLPIRTIGRHIYPTQSL